MIRIRVVPVTLSAAAALFALAALTSHAHARPKADGPPAAAAVTGVVNLNTATEEELGGLPGVGASKAATIVAWRKKHGPFKKVDDLTHVKGFGRKTVVRLRPHLSVSGATTLQRPKAGGAPRTRGTDTPMPPKSP